MTTQTFSLNDGDYVAVMTPSGEYTESYIATANNMFIVRATSLAGLGIEALNYEADEDQLPVNEYYETIDVEYGHPGGRIYPDATAATAYFRARGGPCTIVIAN